MKIRIWCRTHNALVIQVDPDTQAFEYSDEDGAWMFREDNTYCTFNDKHYTGFEGHDLDFELDTNYHASVLDPFSGHLEA